LSEPVFVTIDRERRKITKREGVVHQLVNKSATADLRATKMLFDMIKDVEQALCALCRASTESAPTVLQFRGCPRIKVRGLKAHGTSPAMTND
jgi:hypothetical protein